MSILDIRVQKLFVIVLVLKVGASVLGWWLNDPWILGFAVPLGFMAAYVGLGINRQDKSVSDEKFADTCYYLGFIFTITSIIVSLFDLPNIGTQIQNIAVRFGAAMVSTVVGLGVRVYLVSFRTDVADAIKDSEEALIDANLKFTDQLKLSLERLSGFESSVDIASRNSVERVNLAVESLSRNHADKLTEFFADLTTRNQQAFTNALDEVKTASVRLSQSVDAYATAMRGNLSSIEAKVTAFSDAVTTRLQNTTFPDDYFSRQLAGPLSQLEGAATNIASKVGSASTEIEVTTKALATSLKQVKNKSNDAEKVLDTVTRLSSQQKALLDDAQGQLGILGGLASNLSNLGILVNNAIVEVSSNSVNNKQLAGVVTKLVDETARVRTNLEGALTELSSTLDSTATVNASLTKRLEANVGATELLVVQMSDGASAQASASKHLEESAKLAGQAVAKYTSSIEAEKGAASALNLIGDRADKSLVKITEAAKWLQDAAGHLSILTTGLRTSGPVHRPSDPITTRAPGPVAGQTGVSALGDASQPPIPTQPSGSPAGVRPATAPAGVQAQPETPTFTTLRPASGPFGNSMGAGSAQPLAGAEKPQAPAKWSSAMPIAYDRPASFADAPSANVATES